MPSDEDGPKDDGPDGVEERAAGAGLYMFQKSPSSRAKCFLVAVQRSSFNLSMMMSGLGVTALGVYDQKKGIEARSCTYELRIGCESYRAAFECRLRICSVSTSFAV